MRLHFRWVSEDRPAARWQELFRRAWSSYRAWFLLEGDAARPDLATCSSALRRHMPELVPWWERLVELAGGDETAARMLSLYRPPPYLAGCSQAVLTRGEPVLVRNYDYLPDACEGVFQLSRWSGARVLVSSDCLWGALDGMNEAGLVVALAFGGSRRVGDGFGIPLILRYVLETCSTVAEACTVLRRVPSHMAYNVLLLDASGAHAVAELSPGSPTRVLDHAVCTNHQQSMEWPEHARATQSVERAELLRKRVAARRVTADSLCGVFLRPPIHRHDFVRGMGTLYTVAYRPRELRATYLWPDRRVDRSLDGFDEAELVVPVDA